MPRHAAHPGFCRVFSELDVAGVRLEGIARGRLLPEQRQVRLQVLGDVAAEDHVAVKSHSQIVDADRQIVQVFLPDLLESAVSGSEAVEEFLRRHADVAREIKGAAVGLEASLLPAVAGFSVRHDTHVAELAAPAVGAQIRAAVDEHGAADAIFEEKIDEIFLALL